MAILTYLTKMRKRIDFHKNKQREKNKTDYFSYSFTKKMYF